MKGYFDWNATAPLRAKAREAWLAAQELFWANPSGPTRASARARNFLEAQREVMGECLGIPAERVVFTSGATEGNNAVLRWWRERRGASAGVALSPFEHPSVAGAAERVFGEQRFCLPGEPSGAVRVDAVRAVLAERRPGGVALLAASNETGVVQPWREVHARAREAGAETLCDAVQWIGRGSLEGLAEIDCVTLSGHKLGAPKGVGALLLGPGHNDFCAAVGGGQEDGRRAGTEDLAGIAALVAALQETLDQGVPSDAGRDGFEAILREMGATVLGAAAMRLPQTSALILPEFERTRWIARLDRRGFVIASGAACSSAREERSPTLAAMGISEEAARRMVRVSGGPLTSLGEWERLGLAFVEVLKELRADRKVSRSADVIEI